ncbi:uncharacterized protein TNCV_1114951 [Trichonephila clavipes]|nr:uncharacterized protein TNCV_1114951 [Trichonephila clavipes]
MSKRTVQTGGGFVMVWGVCSWRDMGPLIHLDTTLTGDRYKRTPSPLTPTVLRTALQDLWCQLPPSLLLTLIETMPRRVTALLRARWCPIRY